MSSLRWMLDTDTVSFVLRNEGAAAANVTARPPSALCVSSISLSELRFGADRRRSRKIHGLIDTFVRSVAVVDYDAAAAGTFGRVRAALESKGTPIGAFDTLIAAHALSLGLVLVTNNTRHFSAVPGLSIENWCSGPA